MKNDNGVEEVTGQRGVGVVATEDAPETDAPETPSRPISVGVSRRVVLKEGSLGEATLTQVRGIGRFPLVPSLTPTPPPPRNPLSSHTSLSVDPSVRSDRSVN